MKIKLERDCAISGQHCETGEIVDVSMQDGTYLVKAGLASEADQTAKVKKQTVKKIKVLMRQACMVAGEHRDSGDVVLVLESDAHFLLGHGMAFKDGSDDAKALKATLKKNLLKKKRSGAGSPTQALGDDAADSDDKGDGE